MDQLSLAQTLAVAALPLLFGITLHEVAHGWLANRLGDPTAKMLGRLSLNPLRHIDPVGTVLVPLGMLAMTSLAGGQPLVFGWAKPVPVTWQNLGNVRRDSALVALAGPGANLLMAIGWVLLLRLAIGMGEEMAWAAVPLAYMAVLGVGLNLVLMILNLIPVPPLDGGRVMSSVLPPRWGWQLNRLEPYGLVILLVLLLTGLLWQIVGPPVAMLQRALLSLIGL